jgi:hypothetical protein
MHWVDRTLQRTLERVLTRKAVGATHRVFSMSNSKATTIPTGYLALLARFLQTQLSRQTKKYHSKSKHCGARSDLGITRAKVCKGLSEMRTGRTIDSLAAIFDVRQCELRSLHSYATTSVSSRSISNVFAKGSSF